MCKIIALMAIVMGSGLGFYILWGFRKTLSWTLKVCRIMALDHGCTYFAGLGRAYEARNLAH